MRCEDALPLLYDLVDGEGDITRDDAAAIAEHLARCSECAAALTEIQGREALYRERLGAIAPTRRADEVAEAIWNEGAVPVRLSADRAPFAFAAGTAAAAGIALAGTSDVWGPQLVAWLESARATLAAPASVAAAGAAGPGELITRIWDSAVGLLSAPTAASGAAVATLAAIALVQVAGSAWLLKSGAGGRGRTPGEAS